jgi:hypothetical protein
MLSYIVLTSCLRRCAFDTSWLPWQPLAQVPSLHSKPMRCTLEVKGCSVVIMQVLRANVCKHAISNCALSSASILLHSHAETRFIEDCWGNPSPKLAR